jgi:hypothetical protein
LGPPPWGWGPPPFPDWDPDWGGNLLGNFLGDLGALGDLGNWFGGGDWGGDWGGNWDWGAPSPIEDLGQWIQPVFDPDYQQWGIWLFGFWVPLPGFGYGD